MAKKKIEEAPKEEVKKEPKKKLKKKKFVSPGKLAGKDITGILDIEINGKNYLKVSLSDRSETIMSQSDLDNQIKK